jgi:hypothetical protein
VAQNSQHTQGQAIDFAIPGVPLEKVRNAGLRMQRGGVGFYPTSGSPFVHLDVGSVRHWPRMTHEQLARVFPDGRTVHIPSDGRPLPGYALALADVERRGGHPSAISLETAREAGVITASAEQEAKKPQKSLLATLFGGGNETAEEPADEPAPAPAPKRSRAPVVVANAMPPKPVHSEPVVPLPTARPTIAAPVQVASAAPTMFDTRVSWQGSVESSTRPPPQTPFAMAGADPIATGATPTAALAYAAADAVPPATPRARPMGGKIAKLAREARIISTANAATSETAVQSSFSAPMAIGGQHGDSPWLRAAMLTPSVHGYLTATRMGALDPRAMQELLHKPGQTVLMSFSADPHLGMVAEHFSGSAVVFLATATFARTPQTTAALR